MANIEIKQAQKQFKFSFFLSETFLFLLTCSLGLFLGYKLFSIPEIKQQIEAERISLWGVILAFALGTILLLLLIRFAKGKIIFKGLFYFLIFLGILSFFDILLPPYFSLPLTLSIVLFRYFYPSILSQNINVILAISGMSAYLGISLTVVQVIILLLILSVYDFIAVHKTGHMVKMFRKMAEKGAFFSIIIPVKLRHFFIKTTKVSPGADFLFLGTGDLAFPIIFAVSSLRYSLISSICIIFGSLLGIFGINLFFYLTKKKIPLAALPPIALGAILGFLISLIFI